MNNNKIATAIVQIKNASAARKFMVVLKDISGVLENILLCMKENGYIKDVVKYTKGQKSTLIVHLKYQPRTADIKMYMKEPTIEEFYEENKDKMFDPKMRIISPRVPTEYVPVIKNITNKSKGSKVIYSSYRDLSLHRDKDSNFGILIMTTSKGGIMTHVEAINKGAGGTVLLGVY